MPTNFYFQAGKTPGATNEQRLIEDLVIESLKIYGHDIYYLPRTIINRDTIFDEDTLSTFTQSYPLEMYMENVSGFDGDGELFSKFGLEIRDQVTFVLSKRRWEELTAYSGGVFQLTTRPAEGDLLYFPMSGSIFEIKRVEYTNPFYQLGKIYVFKLQCELFVYSSEIIDTNITEVDNIHTEENLDILQWQFKLEDDTLLLLEDHSCLILEEYESQSSISNTDSADLALLNRVEGIIDFSEMNPFGEL